MVRPDGQPISGIELRRIAIEERLGHFRKKIEPQLEDTQVARVSYERSLAERKIHQSLQALLYIAGADMNSLAIEYTYSVDGKSGSKTGVSLRLGWQDSDQDDREAEFSSIGLDSRSGIEFFTKRGGYIEAENGKYPLRTPEDLLSRLIARDMFLSENSEVALIEDVVSLLESSFDPGRVRYQIGESAEVRRKREEAEKALRINLRIEELMHDAREILQAKPS